MVQSCIQSLSQEDPEGGILLQYFSIPAWKIGKNGQKSLAGHKESDTTESACTPCVRATHVENYRLIKYILRCAGLSCSVR